MPRLLQLSVCGSAFLALATCGVVVLPIHASAVAPAVESSAAGWRATLGVSARAAYDSNVYLQDAVPLPTVLNPVLSRHASVVTTLGASLALERPLASDARLAISYAPESTSYHSANSENHRVHKLGATAGGRVGGATWNFQPSVLCIDGSDEGPVFGCEGGPAALAGIPLRDRRDAVVARGTLRVTVPAGRWLLRPFATAYRHDFQTRHERRPGYLNYIDRQETMAGLDLGRELLAGARVFAGLRVGRQEQGKLHGVDSVYDSTLRRLVVGIEGTPWRGLQLNLFAGPEAHSFAPGTPAGFKRDRVLLWLDGSATLTVSARHVCTIALRRFQQPAFGSASVYEDITYEISWRTRLTERSSSTIGFKAFGGDWPGPAIREDWIFTPSATLRHRIARDASIEASYAFDSAESRIVATAGREFRRHVAALSAQFSF